MAPPDTNFENVQPRAYQIEMFEESMRRNTIVCMDTGSGKTQIAALRIDAALKRSPGKIVWFLTPSVALSQQQHTYLSKQLPSYQHRIITGLDNVQHWSDQTTWDAVLRNMDVIVSTPQVLLDALTHGFLHLSRISLLVFDEAHHCHGRAPMNGIMQLFYHPGKRLGVAHELPNIIGLSASPITGTKQGALEKLEQNLDAICKTPTRHADEYVQFARKPKFVALTYSTDERPLTPVLQLLRRAVAGLKITDDPYVHHLRQDGSAKSQAKLIAILDSGITFSVEQIQRLARRAVGLDHELGPWACNQFVAECISRLHNLETPSLPTLESQERKYVDGVLSDVRLHLVGFAQSSFSPECSSAKAAVLVDFLIQEYTPDIRCVIFVKQRATAWALSRLLSLHPLCHTKYFAAPFVGLSKADRGFQLVELVKMKDPSKVLDDFRLGTINICVATQVMEEGVDIPATNVVVRFDDSENFRSFIQSRGRARHVQSKFVTLGDDGAAYKSWKALEDEMKAKYAEEDRKLAEMKDEDNDRDKEFRVESTAATLTLRSAKQHIEHFCATLPRTAYVEEPRPEFILHRIPGEGVSARIVLPASLDPNLRQTSGSSVWQSERMAKHDAAFEAYLRLYKAGLINDNLLPVVVPDLDDPTSFEVESRDGMCLTSARFHPWREVAIGGVAESRLCVLRLDISGPEQHFPPMLLVLPAALNTSLACTLHWTASTVFTACVRPFEEDLPPNFDIKNAQQVTRHLIRTVFSRKMKTNSQGQEEYPWMILPAEHVACLEEWLDDTLQSLTEGEKSSQETYLVRYQNQNVPYFSRSCSKDDNQIELMRLPRRVDFLHPVDSERAHTAWESLVPRSECCIENLPASYGRLMLFIPSVMHIVELAAVTQSAISTTLSVVAFSNQSLVMTALTASSANESFNYQSLEFLGDSMLKYHTSLQLFAQRPKWPEGYLSKGKDRIVGNARLCRAALELDLDRYIHTEPFAGAQWKPRTMADLLESKVLPKRNVSTKVLADVVEALIGAAYLDGVDTEEAERKCLACMRLLLPTVNLSWDSIQENVARCQHPSLPSDVAADHFTAVEEMIGHAFANRYLVAEALTHPSAIGGFGSYQRLEFLGDAVLDHIVVSTIFREGTGQNQNHFTMHLIRTAIVNADYLAFLCLETTNDLERLDVSTDANTGESAISATSERKFLCGFMTSIGNSLVSARQACISRHREVREQISLTLEQGQKYPWSLLSRLKADKFFSDIIESIVGAIFIDSKGSIEACEVFLEKIGLMTYLRRLLNETTIDIMHPKERLGVVSGNAKVQYTAGLEAMEDGKVTYRAEVLLDGKIFGTADIAYSRLEAETRAAEIAVGTFRTG